MGCAGRRSLSAMLMMLSLVISMLVVPSSSSVGVNPVIMCMILTCAKLCRGNPWCTVPCMNSCRRFQLPPAVAQQAPLTPYSFCLNACVSSNCIDPDNVTQIHLKYGAAKGNLEGCVKGCAVTCESKLH